ncbi:MAG: hypothetical protein HOJ07_07620 [Rhodospirillaceae bacterium]|mgnify:CR=1 FL=1|jgi:hypothetical protein|nr:hypothetical protein [Rhodospirillaceae bacterium]
MKIWIFNILVAGALAYLFLGESEQTRIKGDLEWAKDKVETRISENRSSETDKSDRTNSLRQKKHTEAVVDAKPIVPPSKVESNAVFEPRPEGGEVAPAQIVKNKSPITIAKPVPTVTVEPLEALQPALTAEKIADDGKIARSETASTGGARPRQEIMEDLSPLDDPEVARRRAIILDTDEADADADVHVAVMTARDRRDALNALAMDMELMYVDKASR